MYFDRSVPGGAVRSFYEERSEHKGLRLLRCAAMCCRRLIVNPKLLAERSPDFSELSLHRNFFERVEALRNIIVSIG